MESMTNAPHLLEKSRDGFKYGTVTLRDHMDYDAPVGRLHRPGHGQPHRVGQHGDREFTREEQDAFAARSHQLAAKAWKDGVFDDEVVP
jgi:acetyl-CoA C-acetyltransferase